MSLKSLDKFSLECEALNQLFKDYVAQRNVSISITYNRCEKRDLSLQEQADDYQNDWVCEKEKNKAFEDNHIWTLSVKNIHHPDKSFNRHAYYLASLFYPEYVGHHNELSLKLSYDIEKQLRYNLKTPLATLGLHYAKFGTRVPFGIPSNCDMVELEIIEDNQFCFMLGWNPNTRQYFQHCVSTKMDKAILDATYETTIDSASHYFERGYTSHLNKFLNSSRVLTMSSELFKRLVHQGINVAVNNEDIKLLHYLLMDYESSKSNPYFINRALQSAMLHFFPHKPGTKKIIEYLLFSPELSPHADLYQEEGKIILNLAYSRKKEHLIQFLLYDLKMEVSSELKSKILNTTNLEFLADLIDKRDTYFKLQEMDSSLTKAVTKTAKI